MAVTCKDGWQGVSNRGNWDNHESGLSEAEMIALAGQIPLLPGFTAMVAGTPQCFQDLAEAFKSGDVKITKGIHQRDAKVHFDVTSSIGVTGTFHVFVKTGAESSVISPPVPTTGWGIPTNAKGKTVTRSFFSYEVSGLSYRIGAVDLLYPAAFTRLDELEKPLGRTRRSSLCLGNSTALPSRSEMELMT
ncbi:MAG TPA: hypothetical protein VMQ93_08565 [Novosphingobium sp.]|nr:hypothetical protein [Novosphingobium sp.]